MASPIKLFNFKAPRVMKKRWWKPKSLKLKISKSFFKWDRRLVKKFLVLRKLKKRTKTGWKLKRVLRMGRGKNKIRANLLKSRFRAYKFFLKQPNHRWEKKVSKRVIEFRQYRLWKTQLLLLGNK